MTGRSVYSLSALLVAVALAAPGRSDPGAAEGPPWPGCARNPAVVDACFTVHGRLALGNGNPWARIWIVGTTRKLGVLPDDPSPLEPECLRRLVSPHTTLYADFLVCPLAPERAGWMRLVCIQSASHMVVEEHLGDGGDDVRVRRIEGVCSAP